MKSLLTELLFKAKKSHAKGDFDNALSTYLEILKNYPKNRRAISAKNTLLSKINNTEPPLAAITLINEKIINKQFSEALESINNEQKVFPNSHQLNNFLGIISSSKGDFESAISFFKKSLLIYSKSGEVTLNLANAYKRNNQIDLALNYYKKSLRFLHDSSTLFVRKNILYLYLYHKDHNSLLIFAKDSLKIFPGDLEILRILSDSFLNEAISFTKRGDFKNAKNLTNKAIEIDESNGAAHSQLCKMTRYDSEEQPHLLKMLSVNNYLSINNKDRALLNFSLGKAFEDLKMYKKSFNFYSQANKFLSKEHPYDKNYNKEILKLLNLNFSFKSSKEALKPLPIFILGMPRSGTTLLEQILSAHSLVFGGGELPNMFLSGQVMLSRGRADDDFVLSVREGYIEAIKSVAAKFPFITDKTPHNFVFIPLILSALPEAKVIHIERQKEAVIWSNFKNDFSNGFLNYTNSLEDIVSHYKIYEKLMSSYYQSFGNQIFRVSYEGLVKNPEQEIIKILDYLGLKHEESCFEPEKNIRSVDTNSNFQIRKKIYKDSSKDWEKFEKYLRPYVDSL